MHNYNLFDKLEEGKSDGYMNDNNKQSQKQEIVYGNIYNDNNS